MIVITDSIRAIRLIAHNQPHAPRFVCALPKAPNDKTTDTSASNSTTIPGQILNRGDEPLCRLCKMAIIGLKSDIAMAMLASVAADNAIAV